MCFHPTHPAEHDVRMFTRAAWMPVQISVNGNNEFILEPAAAAETSIIGDVNADGQFSMLDIVMMQKFLLGTGDLTDWTAGDLVSDGTISVFDLAIMKKMLLALKE